MFNQRKRRTFNYKPRYQDSDSDNHREKAKADLEDKWDAIRNSSKRRGNFFTSLPGLILMLIAIFVLIYILEGYL